MPTTGCWYDAAGGTPVLTITLHNLSPAIHAPTELLLSVKENTLHLAASQNAHDATTVTVHHLAINCSGSAITGISPAPGGPWTISDMRQVTELVSAPAGALYAVGFRGGENFCTHEQCVAGGMGTCNSAENDSLFNRAAAGAPAGHSLGCGAQRADLGRHGERATGPADLERCSTRRRPASSAMSMTRPADQR